MPKKRTFVALGGALDPTGDKPPIGESAYALFDEESSSVLLIDCGSGMLDPEDLDQQSQSILRLDEQATPFHLIGGVRYPRLRPLVSSPLCLEELDPRFFPNISFLEKAKHIYLVITHAHNDHGGAAVFLWRQFRSKLHVMMTRPTLDLCQWSWRDYLKISRRGERKTLFNGWDIRDFRTHVTFVTPGCVKEAGPFRLSFYHAGHILGAVGVFAEMQSPKLAMYFSGDVSVHDQHTVKGAILPEQKPDILVVESTYAGKESQNRDALERKLATTVEEALQGGGKVICPTLAIGRVQEVYRVLEQYGITNRYPVYIDGAGCETSAIYQTWGAMDADVISHFVRNQQQRERIMYSPEPLVVIASSGMLTGGRSVGYVKAWAGKSNNLIELSCYQNPCSPGGRLLGIRPGELGSLDGERITFEARVRSVSLSAHADGAELLGLVGQLKPSHTFLVHGAEEGMRHFISECPLQVHRTYINREYAV